ncbi:MAG: Hsp70 family protein [Tissierella sp.]|uniref:Hsp70 family protein n=1 Tax=Tissierella sp. TaxID=41274 RepID=UPI003F94B1DA
MSIKVGIDIGTTFSAIAKINEQTGKPQIIKNSFGDSITPSVLCFEENGNILFGEDAKAMQSIGDPNVIAFFKRDMGNDLFEVEFFDRTYNATDLTAIFLEKIVEEAEKECGEKITSAVITVPAYFTHKERQATIDAGKKAGLEVLSIINEPTSAAFAYGLNDKKQEQTLLIYDLGGGTFDVTIAKIDNNKIDILASDGNHQLGGKDWDDCIARYLAQKFNEKYDLDLTEDDQMVSSLIVKAENTKKQLTSRNKVDVSITYKGINGSVEISQDLFRDLSDFLIGATKELTENLIKSIGLSWTSISGVILVGGSTRMRMIHDYVKDMSGKEPLSGVNVDQAVVLGAAIKANIDDNGESVNKLIKTIEGKENKHVLGSKTLSDVTAHALGMIAISEDGESYINSVIIPKNTSIPAQKKRSYSYKDHRKNDELEVYVLQGDYQKPSDNIIIDKYIITEIGQTNSDASIIDLTYKYNYNGVIDISAQEKETGRELPVKIQAIKDDMGWTNLSPKDVIKDAERNVQIMLAIDLSGSMEGQAIEEAQKSMKEFVNKMDPEHTKIGLLKFADRVETVVEATDDFKKLIFEINMIQVGSVGYCNGAQPFEQALKDFSGQDDEILNYLVVLTDGIWDNTSKAIKKAKECHKNKIEIIALGFGHADYEFLKNIASVEENASLTDLSDLSSSFSKIAQSIGDSSLGNKIKMIY